MMAWGGQVRWRINPSCFIVDGDFEGDIFQASEIVVILRVVTVAITQFHLVRLIRSIGSVSDKLILTDDSKGRIFAFVL